jgi:hypothetical protein
VAERPALRSRLLQPERFMSSRKNTRRQLFSCGPIASLDAVKLARIIADRLAKHPKLRGTTIVVTDEHGDAVCEIPVASKH